MQEDVNIFLVTRDFFGDKVKCLGTLLVVFNVLFTFFSKRLIFSVKETRASLGPGSAFKPL